MSVYPKTALGIKKEKQKRLALVNIFCVTLKHINFLKRNMFYKYILKKPTRKQAAISSSYRFCEWYPIHLNPKIYKIEVIIQNQCKEEFNEDYFV